jgi:hypothetical protein
MQLNVYNFGHNLEIKLRLTFTLKFKMVFLNTEILVEKSCFSCLS